MAKAVESIAKMHPKLAKARAKCEKRISMKDIVVNPSFEQEYIDTGSSILNMLVGGSRLPNGKFVCPGWPKKTMIEIFGRESSGKSTIALTAMGHALSQYNNTGCGLYVDLEHAVKDAYAAKLGCDFRPPEMGGHGRAERIAPHYFEETEQIVMEYALAGVDLIVIDSVAGLVSKREMSRDTIKDSVAVAEVPRLMSQWLPKLQALISKTGTTVIFINQTRDKIGAKGYTEETLKSTTGGNALKFWASLRVMLQPKLTAKAKRYNPLTKETEEVPVSTDILMKMVKNKIDARQGHSGLVTMRYGVGMDEMRTMMNVAQAYNIVKMHKGGNGGNQQILTFKSPSGLGEVQGIGIEKFRSNLQRTPQLYNEMMGLCSDRILQGFKTIDDEELSMLAEDAISSSMEDPDDPSDEYANIGEEPEVRSAISGVDYDEELLSGEVSAPDMSDV